MKLTNQIFR